MEDYLELYGWHFSKKMCEWAVSCMTDRSGKKMQCMTKEATDSLLSKTGMTLKNDKGYDSVFVTCMAKADYWGSSIADEAHLAMFVRDYIDDPDGYEGLPFTRFYADCIGSGKAIIWEDML